MSKPDEIVFYLKSTAPFRGVQKPSLIFQKYQNSIAVFVICLKFFQNTLTVQFQ